ncbi:MAG TPA: hypothetical protein VG275_06910 [Solirubrobacteraceae bacterium]|jgi:hypothetical protein|nr:hypothetical protein [Solirubrobacteraceae bacterium]
MARFACAVESQTAQAAGAPVTTTFNGYFAAVVAGAANGYVLRRLFIGVRAGASVPTSQQMTIGIARQTARVVGTGFSTVVGQNCELYTTASGISGIDVTTATTAGTTGPTVAATFLHKWSFNTQSGLDIPAELLEQWQVLLGTANGLALVNIGNALPTAHLYTVSAEWEE